MRNLLLLTILPAALLAGCYNPELGATPFKCAVNGELCPEGYICHGRDVDNNNYGICYIRIPPDTGVPDRKLLSDAERLPSKEGPVYLDLPHQQQAPATCKDASSEPNNGAADATELFQGLVTGWEICYKFDVDQFKVNVQKGQTLKVKVIFTHSKGDLDAVVFDPDGFEVAVGRSTTNNEEMTVTAQESGLYIIGVWGHNQAVNTYDMDTSIN